MAALNMSVKHGQSWDDARANFQKGISAAETQHAKFIRSVEWSDDRTSARLLGPGFAVDLRVDEVSVHAVGDVPFFVKFMEGPIRKFVEDTLKSV
jgi:hypothetical protein